MRDDRDGCVTWDLSREMSHREYVVGQAERDSMSGGTVSSCSAWADLDPQKSNVERRSAQYGQTRIIISCFNECDEADVIGNWKSPER